MHPIWGTPQDGRNSSAFWIGNSGKLYQFTIWEIFFFNHVVDLQYPHFTVEAAKTHYGWEHASCQVRSLLSALENRSASCNLVWHFFFLYQHSVHILLVRKLRIVVVKSSPKVTILLFSFPFTSGLTVWGSFTDPLLSETGKS